MLNISYVNSKGDRIYLTKEPYMMLADTEIFNPEWKIKFQDKKYIKNIYKECLDDSIQIRVSGKNYTDYLNNLNALFDVMEYDMLNDKSGKLYLNDFYLNCRIYEFKKPDKFLLVPQATVECSICSDGAFMWNKDVIHQIKWKDYITSEIGKKYPYRYPYRYISQNSHHMTINLDIQADVYPEFIIYGKANDPLIQINDILYGAFVELDKNEILVVNSELGKIYTQRGQATTNVFNRRFNNDMLNEFPLDTRRLNIYWNNDFDFDLILHEKRGEPIYED